MKKIINRYIAILIASVMLLSHNVPAEAVEAYRAADTWKEFGTIAAIPAEGIDQITNDKSKMTNKIIRDGILLIEKNGKLYNAQGVEVR